VRVAVDGLEVMILILSVEAVNIRVVESIGFVMVESLGGCELVLRQITSNVFWKVAAIVLIPRGPPAPSILLIRWIDNQVPRSPVEIEGPKNSVGL